VSAEQVAGDRLKHHPVVEKVLSTFGGEVLKIKAEG